VELILPIAHERCARFAHLFGGSCATSARKALTDRDVVVDARRPILVTLSAPARRGFSLEGDGRFATLTIGDPRVTVRVSCLTPRQALGVTVSGRRAVFDRACRPGFDTDDLHLAFTSHAKPQVDLFAIGTLHVEGSARTVTVLADQPTLRVGDRGPTELDSTPASVTITPASAGAVAIDRVDVAGRRSVRVVVPHARRVRLRGHGEQLQSLYDRDSDVLLLVAGLFLGIALSQLVDLMLERRS
jgi:hypothetical protein